MKWPELITAMDRKARQTMAQLEEAKVHTQTESSTTGKVRLEWSL